MSLWEQIINQPGFEKIKTLYNENFPLEVRFVCAQWIEDRIKDDLFIDINDPQYEHRASNFLQNLIQQLEVEKNKFQKPDDIAIRYRIDQAINTFTQQIYNPVPVYKQIRDALMYEQQFLENYSQNPQMLCSDNEALEITDQLKQLRQLILHNGDNYNRFKHELEHYMISFTQSTKTLNEWKAIQATPEEEERRNALIAEYHRKIQSMTENITARRMELFATTRNVTDRLSEVQKVVIHKRLGKWQRDQALAGNGAPLPINALDEIQGWFEELADLIWSTRTLIDTIRKSNLPVQGQPNDIFEGLYREITTLLQNLIVSAFIVEKQPPQVMKTNTRYITKVI